MPGTVKHVIAAIDYIESHLHEKPDLETVAKAVHYSKYHLHRMFTNTAGMTIQTYMQRRRLTEAAKLLVFSHRPILEIALSAGYESQQSFTDIFKAMYKKSPSQYRQEEEFYPLQLRYILKETPANTEEKDWQDKITFAEKEDIPQWMDLVHLVIDGFPHLDEKQYLEQLQEYIPKGHPLTHAPLEQRHFVPKGIPKGHPLIHAPLEQRHFVPKGIPKGHPLTHAPLERRHFVPKGIKNKQALIIKDMDTAIGIMAFQKATGSIDFLGVHPQYPKREIAKAFCEKALHELAHSPKITVTTFREGDKADTGYRKTWKSLGFTEAELLIEFGYPTQRFILQEENGGPKNE